MTLHDTEGQFRRGIDAIAQSNGIAGLIQTEAAGQREKAFGEGVHIDRSGTLSPIFLNFKVLL